MIIESIIYRHHVTGEIQKASDFVIKDAGVILFFGMNTQVFIPWHRVEQIEQSINPSGLTEQEAANKKLTRRLK